MNPPSKKKPPLPDPLLHCVEERELTKSEKLRCAIIVWQEACHGNTGAVI
jgi:hypothetical protein